MKEIIVRGLEIKTDNGSGHSLAMAFPRRRFHDNTVYLVRFNGAKLDNSTVVSIQRAKGWAK